MESGSRHKRRRHLLRAQTPFVPGVGSWGPRVFHTLASGQNASKHEKPPDSRSPRKGRHRIFHHLDIRDLDSEPIVVPSAKVEG